MLIPSRCLHVRLSTTLLQKNPSYASKLIDPSPLSLDVISIICRYFGRI